MYISLLWSPRPKKTPVVIFVDILDAEQKEGIALQYIQMFPWKKV